MGIRALVALVASLASLSLASSDCDLSKYPFMFRGWDISKLDLLPPAKIQEPEGLKKPILEKSCDQVWDIRWESAGVMTSEASFYSKSEQVRKSRSYGGGAGGVFKGVGLSASTTVTQLMEAVTQNNKSVTEVIAYQSIAKISLLPSWILKMDSNAKYIINKTLTDRYSKKNNKPYDEFINEFGTHYFSHGIIGGYLRLRQFINSSYAHTKSSNELKTSTKLTFAKVFSFGTETTQSHSEQINTFNLSSRCEIKHFGGDMKATVENDSGFKNWQDTIKYSPWLMDGILKPISDLIQDSIIKSSMEDAVAQYTMRESFKLLKQWVNENKKCKNTSVRNTIKGIKEGARLNPEELRQWSKEVDKCIDSSVLLN